MTARPCACGCGVPLTGRQRTYASKGCVLRANRPSQESITRRARQHAERLQTDPAFRSEWLAKVRKGHAQRRMRHWWQEAHLDGLWRTLTTRTDVSLLSEHDQHTLRVVLGRAMRAMYQRGYRVGWQTAKRRRSEVAA